MKKTIYITIIFSMTILYSFASNGFTGNLLFSAEMDGFQETPGIASPATGVASFSLNRTHDTMCISVSVKGLSGAITDANIHEGAMGFTGPVITPLASFIVGNTITASLTGTNLTPAMVASFLKGAYYINVQTAANPVGEIRGQILLETDTQYWANMTGNQETPAITTSASSLATFSLSKTDSVISVMAIVHGLSGPIISAHLHKGAMGVVGPIVADLSTGINGNMIRMDVSTTAFLTDLKAGNIYINVHTAANPNGEIRGQLMTDMKLNFDIYLDGLSESPATTSLARGTGTIKVNAKMDTLWYNLFYDGLSAVPTSAHFHEGAEGVAGPAIIDISSGITNNHLISGTVAGTGLTLSFINKMLEGDIYINAHTPTYPNGEIRGQVKRLIREGLTFQIDGAQETPSSTHAGIGAGFASIDRKKENLHFMMTVSDLSGPVTSAHFHNAPMGVAGPVMFDISSFFAKDTTFDRAFGFWTKDDATPFTASMADMFIGKQMYVNMHTAMFPNGETRGQIMQGGACFQTTLGIAENNSHIERIHLYPNPSSDKISLAFISKEKEIAKVIITDILGKQLMIKNANLLTGENRISLDIEQLTPGVYNLQVVFSNKKTISSKFIKQ
jgi:hypothetical protein